MGRALIYLDANVIIRLLEGDNAVRAPIEARLQPLRGQTNFLATSRLSRLECRVKPLREGNAPLLKLYEAFFASSEVALMEINAAVVEKATELRASLNIKTPDALHLATAIIGKSATFLTGDRGLQRCSEVPVELV